MPTAYFMRRLPIIFLFITIEHQKRVHRAPIGVGVAARQAVEGDETGSGSGSLKTASAA